MNSPKVSLILLALAAAFSLPAPAAKPDPLEPWRHGARITAVEPEAARHSIHSYFNTSPESPDGTRILYFTSTAADGQTGELRVREHATGQERVIAQNISTEDAHRAACQQWISGGKRVAFHTQRDGEWLVAVIDLDTGRERVRARDRLLSWGTPDGDVVPIYGKHWNPGAHRDLELLNVATVELFCNPFRVCRPHGFGSQDFANFSVSTGPWTKLHVAGVGTPADQLIEPRQQHRGEARAPRRASELHLLQPGHYRVALRVDGQAREFPAGTITRGALASVPPELPAQKPCLLQITPLAPQP